MWRWADPSWLRFIWVLVALFFVGLYLEKHFRDRFIKNFGGRTAPFLMHSLSSSKRKAHLTLQILILIFFALAMARPQQGSREVEVKQSGVEMIIAVDV